MYSYDKDMTKLYDTILQIKNFERTSEKMKSLKLVVVGVGHVGSYVLADAMKLGLFGEIGVIDLDNGVAHGEALDQSHATALPYMTNIDVTSGGYNQCEDADIIICAAGSSILRDPDNP